VRGSVAPRCLEFELHLPGGVELHPLVRQRRPGDVGALTASSITESGEMPVGVIDGDLASAPVVARPGCRQFIVERGGRGRGTSFDWHPYQRRSRCKFFVCVPAPTRAWHITSIAVTLTHISSGRTGVCVSPYVRLQKQRRA
jgi:hypothetical protein